MSESVNEMVVVEESTSSINLIKDENAVKTENRQSLAVVNEVLNNKPNPVMVKGKRHLEFEDWIALGNAFGIDVATGDAEPVEIFEAKGFKAKAKLIRVSDGTIIGGAEAYCLDNEKNWEDRDYFQMASMAQTRAGSKALSNALRGVVSLHKSLSGTPAEEMRNGNFNPNSESPKPKPKPAAPKPKVPNSSTMGNKPKAPKSIHDKVKEGVPITQAVDEAIEVEVVAPKEPKKPNLATIIKSNKHIRYAVDELQATETKVDRPHIIDKLQDLVDMGKVTIDEYKEAKKLLE